MEGKVAMITGSGSGLGRAGALALARAGADIVITEVPGKEAAAAAAVAEVAALGRRAVAVTLDVRDVASIQAAVAAAVDRLGRLDILVNNAGVNVRKPALEFTPEDWDLVTSVCLRGVFFCAQAAARQMIRQGAGGRIINIASVYGLLGGPNRAAYSASKGGVVNLTRTLAYEWAPHNIQVNAIAPTFVNTPLVAALLEQGLDVVNRTLGGRLAAPEDVAAAIVFLAGPGAGMITGHTLPVDGGWTAW